MIVFCRYKGQCKELAKALRCNYFCSDSPHNTKVIQSWKESGGCVVATSSLGTGVSYKDVALTVHVGMPYGLIDFAQESGRAGRDGEAVASFILLEENWYAEESKFRSSRDQDWSVDELEMIAFPGGSGPHKGGRSGIGSPTKCASIAAPCGTTSLLYSSIEELTKDMMIERMPWR
ncbi:hypothetical protein E4U40_005639 [Claviceps sp. LM458 group G5]|nr:hypothetical protein E4U40_005639 [Claviceps sp. LM458 group G5]